jgi:predicted transcriptional regulator
MRGRRQFESRTTRPAAVVLVQIRLPAPVNAKLVRMVQATGRSRNKIAAEAVELLARSLLEPEAAGDGP